MRSVVLARSLPEGKGVDHDDIRGTNDGIARAISELVPAIGGADFDARGQRRLDSADLLLELLTGEVSAVEGLGTDGYGVNGRGILISDVGDGFEVFLEGLFDIGPGGPMSANCATSFDNACIIPDTQNYLEALALRSGQGILGHVAVRSRIAADKGGARVALDGIEVV